MVYLIIGLPGAGKTTKALELHEALLREKKMPLVIDGDSLRAYTGNNDYSNEGRMRNTIDAATIAAKKKRKGWSVIIAMVCPLVRQREVFMNIFKEELRIIHLEGGNDSWGFGFEIQKKVAA